MTLLSISLLVFGISILIFTILMVIWWKKYGKTMFFTLKDLKNMQNPSNFIENMENLNNFNGLYDNFNNFDSKMTDFNQRMGEIAQKITKNIKK